MYNIYSETFVTVVGFGYNGSVAKIDAWVATIDR